MKRIWGGVSLVKWPRPLPREIDGVGQNMSYCRIQRADNFLDVTAGFMTHPLIYHFGCAVRIVSKIHTSNLGLIDFPAEPDEVGIDRDTESSHTGLDNNSIPRDRSCNDAGG